MRHAGARRGPAFAGKRHSQAVRRQSERPLPALHLSGQHRRRKQLGPGSQLRSVRLPEAGDRGPASHRVHVRQSRERPVRTDAIGPRTWMLAAIAGWALLAWLLALFGMGGSIRPLPDDPALVQALPQLRAPAAERLGPLATVLRDRRAAAVFGKPPARALLHFGRRGRRATADLRFRPEQRADHARA